MSRRSAAEGGLWGAVEGGGSWFRCAIGDDDGHIWEQARIPTGAPAETLSWVVDWLRLRAPRAVGVGCFGPLRLTEGCLGVTPKAGWSGVDLRGALSALGVPVAWHTDVSVAALGEHRHGAGRGAESLLYVTVGTGIGGGLLREGQLVGGAPHPELGHLPLPRQPDDGDFEGVCPFHRDCLEGFASGPALRARWGVPGEALPAGHPAWDREARYLASGLRAALAVVAPARVILGGGVGESPALWPPLRAHLRAQLRDYWPAVVADTWVVPPGLGATATLVGGLVLAREAHGHTA